MRDPLQIRVPRDQLERPAPVSRKGGRVQQVVVDSDRQPVVPDLDHLAVERTVNPHDLLAAAEVEAGASRRRRNVM